MKDFSAANQERYKDWRAEARRFLGGAISQSGLPDPLKDAVRHGSTRPDTSRWRALLLMDVGLAIETKAEALLPAAAAIAKVLHCATLSIDDLPSMEDAESKRSTTGRDLFPMRPKPRPIPCAPVLAGKISSVRRCARQSEPRRGK